MKKVIINFNQSKMLAKYVNENKNYDNTVKSIVDDIKRNYSVSVALQRQGGEYFEKPMITIKADDEMISPKDLLGYMKYKHKDLSDKFLKQIILDWVNGQFTKGKYELSKNVSLN